MPNRRSISIALLSLTAVLSCSTAASGRQEESSDREDYRVLSEISYATVGDTELFLDLYLPEDPGQRPLIVWVHGGAWRSGSRASMPLKWLLPHGFAVASVDYRLSPVARFPAQVHDCKAAIRFLRGRQKDYGYDATRIAVIGSSAGGHLAALIGTTNGHAELEGTVGDDVEQSSDVEAIVDNYGPTNFTTILKQSTPHGLSVRVPALQLLLGDQPENQVELARLASPVFHVDEDDPPILMLHGDQDPQVPINQSHELHGACRMHGVDATFEVVYGGAHGGEAFFDEERRNLVLEFLRQRLP